MTKPTVSPLPAGPVTEHICGDPAAACDLDCVARAAETLPPLTSRERHKGTGDVLKDLAHAQHLTDTSEPGFGRVICHGDQLDFVNRAIRVAIGEIKTLRQRKHR